MFKKWILFLLLFIIVLSLVYLLCHWYQKQNEQSDEEVINHPTIPEKDEELQEINDILENAEYGKIKNTEIIVGVTEYEEVTDILGEPDRIEGTEAGIFALYPNQDITIGYQRGIAYDLRSYDKEIQRIHYQRILEELGEPDDIKYYQDHEFNQIILIYNVNDDYQLKWILDKPDNEKPNPLVHHISIVATHLNLDERLSLSVSQILDEMSLEEKIGQLIFAGVEGTSRSEKNDQLIKNLKVGGIILNKKNLDNPSQTVLLINRFKALNDKNPIPLFFGIDQEGGRISKLPGGLTDIPTNMEIGQVNNQNFSFEIGQVLGKMVKVYGFNVNFAPVLDVNSNPNNPVIGDRSFGNNPYLVADLGIQTMKGLMKEKIIPTIKHFPGHGDTSVDSHLELPRVDKTLSQLKNLELIPFKRAIQSGAEMVMVAHLLLPEIDPNLPSSLSEKIVSDLLRKDLGFNGVVITDDLTMKAISGNFTIGAAAVKSIKAGTDMVMVAHKYENILEVFSALKEAVLRGELSEERINESVQRILELKKKYEISDDLIATVKTEELNHEIEAVLYKYLQ